MHQDNRKMPWKRLKSQQDSIHYRLQGVKLLWKESTRARCSEKCRKLSPRTEFTGSAIQRPLQPSSKGPWLLLMHRTELGVIHVVSFYGHAECKSMGSRRFPSLFQKALEVRQHYPLRGKYMKLWEWNWNCSRDPRKLNMPGMCNVWWGKPQAVSEAHPRERSWGPQPAVLEGEGCSSFFSSYLITTCPSATCGTTRFNICPAGFWPSFDIISFCLPFPAFWNGSVYPVPFNFLLDLYRALTAKSLLWVSQETLDLDFLAMLKLLKLQWLLERD